LYLGGVVELLPNSALSQIIKENLQKLNDLHYDKVEEKFAVRIQSTLSDPVPLTSISHVEDQGGRLGTGSTDVGDVSWVVPTAGFSTACWVPGTPAHSWQAVAAGGMSIGRKGMQLAARVLAASAWDLYENPQILVGAKAEHQRQLSERKYQTLLEPNQAPPLDYRDPPRRR